MGRCSRRSGSEAAEEARYLARNRSKIVVEGSAHLVTSQVSNVSAHRRGAVENDWKLDRAEEVCEPVMVLYRTSRGKC